MNNVVNGSDKDTRLLGLARTAREIREQTFYRACGLRLMTWDDVSKRIPLLENSHKQISAT